MESDIYGSTSTQKTENQYSPTDMYTQTAPNSITADKIYSLNGLDIGAGQFTVDANGNVTFAGTLSGASGTFSGSLTSQTITASNISSLNGLNVGNGNFVIDTNGNVTLKGSISSGSSISGASISSSSISSSDASGSLSISGSLVQSSYGSTHANLQGGTLTLQDNTYTSTLNTSSIQVGYTSSGSSKLSYDSLSIDNGAVQIDYNGSLSTTASSFSFNKGASFAGDITLQNSSDIVSSAQLNLTSSGFIKVQSSSDYVYLESPTQVSCTQVNTTSSYIPVYASAFNASSKREWKKNIKPYGNSAEAIINKTSVYSYNFIDGWVTKKDQVGLISEEAPTEVLDETGSFINLYAMIALAWKAIQELSTEIQQLKGKPM